MKPRIKIAYIITSVLFGGAEKVTLNYLRAYNTQLFNISLFQFTRKWEKTSFFSNEIKNKGMHSYYLPLGKRHSEDKKNYLRLVGSFIRLFMHIKRGNYDIIHTHGYLADIMGILSARMLNVPILSTCHGFIENSRRLTLYNNLDRMVLRYFDKIIAVSKDIKIDLRHSGVIETPIVVISNAVNTAIDNNLYRKHRMNKRRSLNIVETDFVIGYFGRLSIEKGLAHLIDGISLLAKGGIPVKLIIIGDGPENDTLKDLTAAKGLDSITLFPGFQDNINEWIPALDVFVLPSLREGTPMALLEAMAHGIPAIASAVGEIPHIIESGKSGILINPGEPEHIRNSILFLYNNPSMRKQMALAGQEKVKRQFDIERWCKQVEHEYISLIGRKVSSA